jgi:uncharacterized protein YjiS (DUF1127 family)
METAFGALKPRRTFVTVRLSLAVLTRWRAALRESRKREKLRAALDGMSDRELLDIGIGRGEVDYVASNSAIDPRGAVLPT